MSKKRGNGEGTIARRKNGLWYAQYVIYGQEGRKRRTLYGKTRQEVATKLAKALADREGGLLIDAGKLTLEEYLERWLSDAVEPAAAHRTYHNYRLQVRRHIDPTLGAVRLKALSPAHVQGLYRSKLDAGLSPSSVRYVHAVLHRALRLAVKWSLVPRNVAESVELPRAVKKEIRALSPKQARALLDTARGDRLEALYVLALSCGLRHGELLGLRWSDVDIEARTLGVMRQLQRMRDGSGLRFLPTKNAKERSIRLTEGAAEALKAHRKRQLEERLKAGGLYQDQGLVFATTIGTPMEPSNVVGRSFKPMLEAAGLPDIRFHDLRHTCATLMLGEGVHPKVAQERMGHSAIAVTMNTYSHVMPDVQDQAAAALDAALS